MEEFHISSALISVIGATVSLLLGVIAFFLSRLLTQFDTLNETVKRIDKDLSGDVGLLKANDSVLKRQIEEFEPMWDRVRTVENDVTALKSGGCDVYRKCNQ